ncbi:MAG: hypothetical protein JO034_22595 [Singulisphaera sp.]|nr:hypothetical protein [Singulisphaera sp.]
MMFPEGGVRREEVAMGRLKVVTILIASGVWGAGVVGAPPDQAAPPTDAASKPPAPVPSIKYLKTGARLFHHRQYAEAGRYLRAADLYRDQLTDIEQIVLDGYLSKLDTPAREPLASSDPGVAPVEGVEARPPCAAARTVEPAPLNPETRSDDGTTPEPLPDEEAPNASASGLGTRIKPRAGGVFRHALEPSPADPYDYGVRGTSLEPPTDERRGPLHYTLERMGLAIRKATATLIPPAPRTQRAAQAKLKQARESLAEDDYDHAEAIALEVKGWGLSFDRARDTPDRVILSARALRLLGSATFDEARPRRDPSDPPALGVPPE